MQSGVERALEAESPKAGKGLLSSLKRPEAMKLMRENGLRGLVGSRSQIMPGLSGYSKEMGFTVKTRSH